MGYGFGNTFGAWDTIVRRAMTRKNIKVPEPLFNALRDDKDDAQSWPHYLETECLHDGEETPTVDVDTVSLEASERRAIARAVADELR